MFEPIKSIIPKLFVPDYVIPYETLLLDSDGFLWGGEQKLDPAVPQRWHIFDRTGAWAGDFMLPVGLRLVDVGRDHLIVTQRDEDDMERLLVYGLARTPKK